MPSYRGSERGVHGTAPGPDGSSAMAEVDWTFELIDQLDHHWQHQLRPRLEGLTDAEYLWEPVAGCWSLRPRGLATTPLAAGGGEGGALHVIVEVERRIVGSGVDAPDRTTLQA